MSDAREGAVTQVERLRDSVIAALRVDDTDFGILAEVCDTCVRLLPIDGAAISVVSRDGERETLYTSDTAIQRIEAIQSMLGEGPGIEAFKSRRPVLVPDLAHDSANSWPVFAAETASLPVAAIFAFPLYIGAIPVGAIDFYRRRSGWFTDDQLAIALRLVDVATLALLGTQTGGLTAGTGDERLADLPHGSSIVHQATGMLIAQFQIPADQALARLRGYAFSAGLLVEDVALDLTARRLSPGDIDN